MREVRAILDYRRARQAIDLFNDGRKGAHKLAEHPELIDLLVELCRAQAGNPDATVDDAYAALRAAYGDPDDEDED